MAEVSLWQAWLTVLLFTLLSRNASASLEGLQFTRPLYNLTIPENAVGKTQAVPTEKMGIFVTDPSLTIRYKIISGDPLRFFKAETRPVGDFWFLIIRVKTGNRNALNREYQDTYRLAIRATITSQIRPQVKIKAQTEAIVRVTDTNDITPFFYPATHYDISVPEDTPLHKSLLQVSAFDPDLGINSEIYYVLVESTLQFAIHPTRGTLSLTRPLDYQTQPYHELTVVAEDRGVKFRAADITVNSATVRVKVTPVNLYPPEIFVRQFPALLTPADPNVYAVVLVHDKDQGIHGEIDSLEIISGDPEGFFRITQGSKANEYNIELDHPLLRSSRLPDSYTLTLRAKDRGIPSKATTQVVTIKIAESRTISPSFSQADYDVEIEEIAPPGSRVIQLETTLPDATGVYFRIESGNANGTFKIHSKTALLTTVTHLDKESQPYYSLTVSMVDSSVRGLKRKATAIVNIRVLDNNDNDPVFNMTTDVVVFDENKPAGSIVYTVFAFDKDQDDNGYVTYSLANLNPVPFTMDPFTGEIRSTEVLDYETMRREYILKVRASDWGTPYRRQSEMTLKVKLRDINDHRPLFEKVGCTGFISETAPLHTEVVTLSAIDFDVGSSVTYRMVPSNEDPCFKLDRFKGILRLTCNLSKQNFREKVINVSATDGTHFADVIPIHLKVVSSRNNQKLADRGAVTDCKDVGVTERFKKQLSQAKANNRNNDVTEPTPTSYSGNRYHPEFSSALPTEVWVNESLPVGFEIAVLKARDKDRGYSGQLVYVISSGDDWSYFKIDMYTGVLVVHRPLDRETISRYELNISAYDLGHPPYSVSRTLIVHVGDVNDNEPTFEKSSYNFVITENVKNGTSIVRLRATDRDEGINSALTFSLETDLDEFSIDPVNGLLSVCGVVDREVTDSYHIKVRVRDGALDHPLSSTTIVNVRVLDVNDNPPAFSLSQYWVKVREDLPVGSVIMIMSARDPDLDDGGRVTYKLSTNDHFSIDPLMGVIRLSSALDFENIQVFDLVVTAMDSGEPSLTSQATLMVEVEDVNENMYAPVFDDVVYAGEVRENQPKGTVVMSISAHDADGPGINGQIVYSIRDGDGMGYFSIDNQGVIRTSEVLDRETNHRYWLTVHAMDRAAVPLSGRVDIYIAVLDENDNVPLTREPAYYPAVPENSPPGMLVVQLEAVDLDSDDDLPLHFSIASGDPQGFFTIDNRTGLILTAATSRRLDREIQSEHALEVHIEDSGNPPLSSATRVVVKVSDVNDNDPKFWLGNPHQCPVLESNTPLPNRIVCHIIALDEDEGENGRITYSLENDQSVSNFRIDSRTGAIYSTTKLTAGEIHKLVVKATDNGSPQRYATFKVSVEVLPRPSSSLAAPKFPAVDHSVTIAENDRVGLVVAFLEAKDPDGDHLWYSIVDGNSDSTFMIQTGAVVVSQPLNWTRKSEYRLNISVTDGIHTVYQQLEVQVSDVNDQRPVFSSDIYTVDVLENELPGKVILHLEATDDQDSRLFFSLFNSANPKSLELFQIDSVTGKIAVAQPLDHESVKKHFLTVMVGDNGTPSKRSFARVVVNVLDVNDHAPEFLSPAFDAKVYETAAIGSSVIQVLAIDKDKGDNANLHFRIASGNIGNAFTIDPVLGTILVEKQLNKQVMPEYFLVVQAIDKGIPSLNTTATVHVTVTLANNAPPKFDQEKYAVEVYENEKPGKFVIPISATSRSSVYYEIVAGNIGNSFVINPTSGVLRTRKPLDYETLKFYNLTIRATNMVGANSTISVFVHVLDRNDNSPLFYEEEYRGQVLESDPVGTMVLVNGSKPLVIAAYDNDSEINSVLMYRIVEQSALSYFSIDPNTGAIRTARTFDHEKQTSFSFTVQVWDLGKPRLSAEIPAKVFISVIDINDSPPHFDKMLYTAVLYLPTFAGVHVIDVHAEDPDSISRIKYKIVSGDGAKTFAIDENTGRIEVKDSESLGGKYSLVVRATDGEFEASAKVMVKVQEKQQNELQFSEEKYFARIRENSTEVRTVAVITVLGSALREHLTFRILNPNNLFVVGETSGVVRTTGKMFDREVQMLYTLVVEVTSEFSKHGNVLVEVAIDDVNDNPPFFVKLPYSAVVPVDAQLHYSVFKVEAVDLDSGNNGKVIFEIVDGDRRNFHIDRMSGIISVVQVLTADKYELVIAATDQGEPPLSSNAEVVIRVINSDMPIFDKQVYHTSVLENLATGTAIMTVTAESPHGRQLIYSLVSGDRKEDFRLDFNTEPELGNGPCVLHIAEDLDFETTPSYQLVLRATDAISGIFSDVQVTVQVIDVNDNPPMFSQPSYNTTVSEAAPFGTAVLQVKASDRDSEAGRLIQYFIVGNATSHFQIDSSEGIVYITQPLDHETKSEHYFIVMATDGGTPMLNSTAHVWITVADVNDNPPKFDTMYYECFVSQEVKRGHFVTMVMSSDPDSSDHSRLSYAIVGGNGLQSFAINRQTGVITLLNLKQFSFETDYILNVSVTDGVYASYSTVHVTVEGANNYSPHFTHNVYPAAVPENAPVGTQVVTVSAVDRDIGKYGKVHYSIASKQEETIFQINSETGELYTNTKLDREKHQLYEIVIAAVDAGHRCGYAVVRVTVTDENDNVPQFAVSEYKATVPVNMTIGTTILRIHAIDMDDGPSATLEYSIYKSNNTLVPELFGITHDNGELYLRKSALGQESYGYQFFVEVRDHGSPPHKAVVPVNIFFVNADEDYPRFENFKYTFYVSEKAPIGTIISTLNVSSSSRVRYSLTKAPGGSEAELYISKFSIDSKGNIILMAELDREERSTYYLNVEAETMNIPSRVSSTDVTIVVMDENDNTPRFHSNLYNISIAENIEKGATVLRMEASDLDQGKSSLLSYSFGADSDKVANTFQLDPKSGWLTTLVTLDREETPYYNFTVNAFDHGTPARMSSVVVYIRILDYNDNPPEFPLQHYKSQVVEDAAVGTTVITLTTVDKDEEKSNVVFHITNGNPRGQFSVLESGKLFISKPLDREDTPNYQLEITATDGKFVTKTWVSVDVSDVNDNPPVCLKTKYTEIVSESIAPETYILTVEASDSDSYSNSRLFFSLSGEGSEDFMLDSITGVLKTKKGIDREKISRYHLTAHVRDKGRHEWECTSTIEVLLSDVNDNAPVFTQDFYMVTIPEDSEVGTLITKVHATDRDIGPNRMISYSLVDSAHNHFQIDDLTGIVHLNKPVDREVVPRYNLTIQASDHGVPQLSSVCTLIVALQDINDNPPEFTSKIYQAVVPETAPLGVEVLKILAASKDAGVNAEITYSVVSDIEVPPFSIHPKSGLLTVSALLDYEKQRGYYFSVQAIDGGSPPLSTQVPVNITITDANDNAPEFSQNTYNAVVREDAVAGDKILQVLAVDADSPPNSRITYSICGGDRTGKFFINRDSGYISLVSSLDREKVSNYVLEICCEDSGTPSLSSSAMVNIEVSDVNDNPPLFSEDNYTAIVQEGKPLGFTVLKFTVSDQDAPPNTGPFIFEILSGNEENAFRLVQQDATLRTASKFDHKNRSEYILHVRVKDGGNPPLHSDTWVHILIIEESRYPPVVTPLDITVNSYLDEFPGGVLGRVHATDEDPYDKLQFEIVSAHHNLFSIDREDGTLVALPGLDVGTYEVNISVSDGKFITHTAVAVDVTMVSEDALKSSVILRLGDITPEDFLLSYKKEFLRSLRNVLNVRIKDVEIISLQPSVHVTKREQRSTSQNLDIVFAVRKGSKGYYPSEQVRQKIKEKVDAFEANLALKVIEVMEDRCADDQCINGECVDLIVLDKAFAISITTETLSYVFPQHYQKLECVCDPGFGGPQCESAVNECARRPCPSYRVCVPEQTVLGYLCKCPEGKTGPACERDKGSVCKRPTCYEEKTPVSFQGQSYVSFVLKDSIEQYMSLKLYFRTKQETGNLMFAAGVRDYSILEVLSGFIQYRFDCGSGEGVLRIEQAKVNDGIWHEVSVERKGKTAELTLDNRLRATGKSRGPYEVLSLDGNDIYFGAEIHTNLAVLGYEDMRLGYIGCMDDIKLNGITLPLHFSGNSVAATLNRYGKLELHCGVLHDLGVCGSQPCLNGGTCITTDAGFVCQCRPRFVGKLCETDTNPCASNPCLNGGVCHNVDNMFLCTCLAGISGKRCEFGRYCKPNPCHNGGICEEGTFGPICKCSGYHGELCQYDVNECQAFPCASGSTCVNVQGNFRCHCPPNMTGLLCNEHLHATAITSSSWNTTIEEIVGISLVIVVILLLAMVLTCCWRYHHKRQQLRPNNQVLDVATNEYLLKNTVFEKDHFNRISKISNLEVTSFTTPPLPPRPASYTPSTQDSVNALNNFDTVRSYGSAADDLENFPRQGSDYVQNISKPSLTSVPALGPQQPSSSDNDSVKKACWEQESSKSKDKLYDSKVKKDFPARKNGDVPALSNIPPPVVPSRGPSSLGVPSVLSLNSVDDQSASQNPSVRRNQAEGYIWDCSDWAMSQKPLSNIVEVSSKEVRDSSSVPSTESNSQASQIELLPSKPNLNLYSHRNLQSNHSENDDFDPQDSEYVGDSENNDNEYDARTLPNPNFENILGMTDLEFADEVNESVPTSPHKYQRHPNTYLPSHALSSSDMSPEHPWTVNRHQICDLSDDEVMTYGFPPQGGRGFHIERDAAAIDSMSMSVGGYTSTNASFSDISGAVCEIDDSEANCSDADQDSVAGKPPSISPDKFCSTHL